MLEVWTLLVTLATGEIVLGGQYQSEAACREALRQQQVFWRRHVPKGTKWECNQIVWLPRG